MRPWQIRLQVQDPHERDRDIFSYPIFAFFGGGSRRYISGHSRIYLNEEQRERWNYFFRPSLKLINAIDKQRLRAVKAELAALQGIPAITQEVTRLKSRDTTFSFLFGLCAIGAVAFFLLLLIFGNLWALAGGVLLALLSMGLWAMRPQDDIQRLGLTIQATAPALYDALDSVSNREFRLNEVNGRIAALAGEIGAMEQFRRDIQAQRPELRFDARSIEVVLESVRNKLKETEKERLNIYAGDEPKEFGPVLRGALETSRKEVLNSLRFPIHSIVRRDSHYARYEVQFVIVHRGRLTVYEGFYDLIQGEMMGETRRHVVLANVFSVREQVTKDFDFRANAKEIISQSNRDHAGERVEAEAGEEVAPDTMRTIAEEDVSRVDIMQTRVVQLVGTGDSVELKFVVSERRNTWIAELERERLREEKEIEALKLVQQVAEDEDSESATQLDALEDRLLRIREFEERVRRTEPAKNVEEIVNQILEYTATGQQRRAPGPLDR